MRTLSDILLAIKPISISGNVEVNVAGLTLDSRAVKVDYVFAAIKGVSTDGHLFIPKAISLGANGDLVRTTSRSTRRNYRYFGGGCGRWHWVV